MEQPSSSCSMPSGISSSDALSQPWAFWKQLKDVPLPPMPVLPITSPETLRKCREMKDVGSRDIFICSYPKSGTTWMQNIVYQLLEASRSLEDEKNNLPPLQHISDYSPFFEIDPHWKEDRDENIDKIQQAHETLGYRLFNTHLRYDMMPNSSSEDDPYRAIYVVRDGRDVCTSFYHHMINQHVDDGGFPTDNFDDFFQAFADGTVAFGKRTHHLASWLPEYYHQEETNDDAEQKITKKCQILLVRYEDLKKDIKKELWRIAQFLNLDLLLERQQSHDPIWESIFEKVSFSYMREYQSLFHPISVHWKDGYNFIRKGQVGDYETLWTQRHCSLFDSIVQRDFKELVDTATLTEAESLRKDQNMPILF